MGEINVFCGGYEATIGALIVSSGVGFVPNDEIHHGDFFNILDYPIKDYVDDLSGYLDSMIFVRALNGCLEDSRFTINPGCTMLGEDYTESFAPSVNANPEEHTNVVSK